MTTTGAIKPGGLVPLMHMPEALADLSRSAALMQAFRRCIPEFATGRMALQAVEPRRVRLREGPCTAIFDLTVDDGQGGRLIRLNGIADPWGRFDLGMPVPTTELGSPDWRCGVPELRLTLQTPPPDTALASMSLLISPEKSLDLLRDALRRTDRYAGARLRSCEPTIARYKPGSRCTVVYQVVYEPGHAGPERVIAKTHHGDKGRTAFEGMRALWHSPLRSSEHVAIAEPLTFLEDLDVLLQGPVPGTMTLKDLAKPALAAGDVGALGQVFGQTGRGLAALHRCGAHATPASWQQELADVRKRVKRLARWVPGLDPGVTAWLDALEARTRLVPADPSVPSHRSFRPAQVLLDGDDIGFIDFDGFCEAEPAMDLALFMATIKGMRTPATMEEVERSCDDFLDGYRELADVTPHRTASWEALHHLTNALNCWAKVRPERVTRNLALLDRHIERTELPSI